MAAYMMNINPASWLYTSLYNLVLVTTARDLSKVAHKSWFSCSALNFQPLYKLSTKPKDMSYMKHISKGIF